MKLNFSLILPLLFLLGSSCSPRSKEFINEDNQQINYKYEYILIAMKGLNKYIWVLEVDERAVKKFGISFNNIVPSRSGKSLKYEINDQMSFEANGVQIDVGETDVFLNGKPMGKNLNSVIDSQGRVRIGEFYRTFE